MSGVKRLTVATLRAAARRAGGTVEDDGNGGYDLLAPDGRRWCESETWCQPVPLGEADDADERQTMLRTALSCCTAGHEPNG